MATSRRSTPPDGRPLFRLLAVAVAAWAADALAFITWFFATEREPGLAAVGIPFVAWLAGYPAGLLALVAYGAVQAGRGRISASGVAWGAIVYLLPAALAAVAVPLPRALMPATAVENDLGGMLAALIGPLLIVLYVAGLAAGFARRDRPLRAVALAIMMPPAAGAILLGAWIALSAVRSPEFRHRDDFALEIQQARFAPGGGLTIDATVEVKSRGAYEYSAIYLETRGGTIGGRVAKEVTSTCTVGRGISRARALAPSTASGYRP